MPEGFIEIGDYAFECSSLTTLIIFSDHGEARVLTQESPFDTAAVKQALEQSWAA